MTLFKSINPYNQKVIATYEADGTSVTESKIQWAQTAFEVGKQDSFQQRSAQLMKLAQLLESEKLRLGKLMSEEMGKPIQQSYSELDKCVWVCKYYAENGKSFLAPEVVKTDASESWVTYEPLGVILAIMPWNFPFWQVFRFLAPTLMVGNTAILKHAPNVLGSALEIESLVAQAGFRKGTLQNLIVEVEQVASIIEHDSIKAVTLTGSGKAGSSVASIAGKNIKKCVLELGGSNSFIVHHDAILDQAVNIGVSARMQNNGQSCIAAKRFLVHESIAEEYIEKFTQRLSEYTYGNPLDESITVGPLARVDLAEELERQVDESVKQGAIIICGGKRDKAYYEPTVLVDVTPGMPAFDEELFGPVASFIRYKELSEAIRLSNQSNFGLGVSLFTQNLDLAKSMVSQFEDGAVFINGLVKSDPRLPFGGTKMSGYGRELGKYGIQEFTNVKTVHITSS